MEITEVLIKMEKYFSETQLIEFLGGVGCGGDILVPKFLSDRYDYTRAQINLIRAIVKMDSAKNIW